MSLGDELTQEISDIFRERWATTEGRTVPETDDLRLANDAVTLDGTVLYADLSGSTTLVDTKKPDFAAEIYKAYLYGAAKIIRSEGGSVTAYDGDRVMAVFIGEIKNSPAARTALKINYLVTKIINPALKEAYPKTTYEVRQTVGIDTSTLLVARTGIRGANDLVWVGRAANYAAKLCELSPDYPSRITKSVYDKLNDDAKTSSNGEPMWAEATWTAMNDLPIYRSTWRRKL